MKKVTRYMVNIFLGTLVVAGLCGCGNTKKVSVGDKEGRKTDVEKEEQTMVIDERVKYVNELLNVDISDYVLTTEGEIVYLEDGIDEGFFYFKLKAGSEDELAKLMTEPKKMAKMDVNEELIPGHTVYDAAKKLESMERTHAFQKLFAKGRTVYVFIATDGENSYLFFLG